MTSGKWLIVIGWTFLCPGAGQAVAGRRGPAFAWAGLALAAVLAIPATIWAVHVALAIRIAAVADAIVRIRRARPAGLERDAPAMVATGAMVVSVVYWVLFLEQFRFPSSSMYPTIHIGDQVVVERLTLLWRDPERGDLVVFEHPCQRQVSYMKRVVAVGSDTIEIRCNVLHVNGAAVAEQPIEGASCHYFDREMDRDDWFRRQCSRYRETTGGRGYDVFHDAERPQRDELAKVGRLERGDDKDFPRIGEPPRSCGNAEYYDGGPSSEQQPGKLVETKAVSLVKSPCEPQLHFVVPPGSLFVLGDNRSNSNDSRYWGTVPVSHVRGRVIGIHRPLSRIGDR